MVVFEKPKALTDAVLHYCPGCTHGIVHRRVAEAIDELGIEGKTIGVAPVGCSVMAYDYFACDMIEASHGRAPAVATGVKRALPDNIVFAYQGDGDLASIGLCETVSTAARVISHTTAMVTTSSKCRLMPRIRLVLFLELELPDVLIAFQPPFRRNPYAPQNKAIPLHYTAYWQ